MEYVYKKHGRHSGLGAGRVGSAGSASARVRLFLTAVLLMGVTLIVEGVGAEAATVSAAQPVVPGVIAPQTGISLQSVDLNDGLTATQVAVGSRFSCALSAGSVWCWGSRFSGSLGDGSPLGSTSVSYPVKVAAVNGGFSNNGNVTTISASGATVCAIESGSAYCWGDNRYGVFGNNTTVSSSTPVKVHNNGAFVNDHITQVAVGDGHVCVVRSSGGDRLYCWGYNHSGQLGFETTDTKCELSGNPQKCEVLPMLAGTNAAFLNNGTPTIGGIALTHNGTCAIVAGVVLCWGRDNQGELGRGQGFNATIAAIPNGEIAGGNTGVTAIAAAGTNACAIKAKVVYCWGDNRMGALGDGTPTTSAAPRQVTTSAGFLNNDVTAIAVNGFNFSNGGTSCAIEGGKMFCWGYAPDDGWSIATQSGTDAGCGGNVCKSPVPAVAGEMVVAVMDTGSGAIALSNEHACAIHSGRVFCWGDQADGQLGLAGFTVDSSVYETPWLVIETARPSVSAITPSSFGAGDTVTLSGTNLSASTRVFIGWDFASQNSNVCQSVSVNGAGTELTCTFGATTTFTDELGVQNPRNLGAFASWDGRPSPAYTWTSGGGGFGGGGGGFGGGGGGGGGTGFGGGGGVAPVVNTPTPAAPLAPAGPAVLSPPAAGAAPSLVTAEDAARVQQAPGAGGVRVNGAVVTAAVARVDVPAAEVAPEDRTPEQVASVQEAAAELVASFTADAPAGAAPLVTVTNTDTGAVVNGVVVDPRDGVTPVPVPAEDVVLLSAAETRVLFAAASGEAVPAEAPGAVLEVSEGGVISAVAYGFPASVPGEVVIFSTPTLLGTFTIRGDGSFAGQLGIPEGLEAGEHTLVLTAGGVTTSLGLVVAGDGSTEIVPQPEVGTLPATGADHDPAWLVLLLAIGGLMVLVSRRRYV